MTEKNTVTLTAKELTVAQVLEALDGMDREPHKMAILFPGVPLELVERSLGKSADELMTYPASEIEKAVEKVKELNPFFLNLTARLLSNAEEMKKGML